MTGCMCCISTGRFGRRGVEHYSRRTDFRNAYYERKISDTEMRHLEKLVSCRKHHGARTSYHIPIPRILGLDIKNSIRNYRSSKGIIIETS